MADNQPANRKRSRSPTDADHQNHSKQAKRLNLGSDSEDTPAPPTVDKAKDKDAGKSKENGDANANGASSGAEKQVPQQHINMRCLIVTQDASIIIGRGGTHVNEIREKSGAKVMVSESIPGNPERILNVGGPLDAVSKVRVVLVSHHTHSQPATFRLFE